MTDSKPPESDVERARRCVVAIDGFSYRPSDAEMLAAEFAAVRAEARRGAIEECAVWVRDDGYGYYRDCAKLMREALLSPSPKTEETK